MNASFCILFLASTLLLSAMASDVSTKKVNSCKGRDKACQKKCARQGSDAVWTCGCAIPYAGPPGERFRRGAGIVCQDACICVDKEDQPKPKHTKPSRLSVDDDEFTSDLSEFEEEFGEDDNGGLEDDFDI